MMVNEFVTFIHTYSAAIFVVLLLILIVLSGLYWYLLNLQKANAAGEDLLPEHHVERPREPHKGGAASKSVWSNSHSEPSGEAAASPEPLDRPVAGKTHSSEDSVDFLVSLGEKLKAIRRIADVKDSVNAINDGADLVIEAGKSAMAEDRWEQARKYFEEAMRLSPRSRDVYESLAIVCYELGDLSASKKYNEIAIASHSGEAKAFRQYLALRL